jgi:hypothetical protein
MKQMRAILLGGVLAIGVFACQKMVSPDVEPVAPATTAEISKIKAWLKVQRDHFTTDKWLDSVDKFIDWSITQRLNFKESQTLVALPLNLTVRNAIRATGLGTETDASANYLIVTLDKAGEVAQGSIAQITPTDATAKVNAVRTAESAFLDKKSSYNGTFTIFTITKRFLYQVSFKNHQKEHTIELQLKDKTGKAKIKMNGNMKDAGVEKGAASSMAFATGTNTTTIISLPEQPKQKVNSDCLHWYLVWYYPDGTEVWTYVYTTCAGVCSFQSFSTKGDTREVKVMCGGQPAEQQVGDCAYTTDEASALANSLSVASTDLRCPNYLYGGETYNSVTQRYEKTANACPWKFVKLNLPLFYWVTYAADYAGAIYKVSANDWRWVKLDYVSAYHHDGIVTPCHALAVNVTGLPTQYEDDGKYAKQLLTWRASLAVSCLGGIQVGTPRSGSAEASSRAGE